MIYGYARVSTREQKEDRQILALREFKRKVGKIYLDKQSGKDFQRAAYQKMMKRLKKNDIVVVKSIDRLGRNYKEIIEEWRKITKVKKADIIVIDMPLLDTTLNKDLFGTFISDIVLQILSFVAENERENIRKRQAEGIAAAKAKGVRFGRPKIKTETAAETYARFMRGEISQKEAMNEVGVCQTTYYRIVRELREKPRLWVEGMEENEVVKNGDSC